jgi:UDP-N-acetylglucosamine 4-epimerase
MNDYDELQSDLRANPRKWLVTGVAGFIGSHLLEELLKLEQVVVGLDNFSAGKRANLDAVEVLVNPAQWSRFRFLEGDITDFRICEQACAGIDYVLHQAAIGSVPRSMLDPLRYHHINVTGFLNMLVAARDAHVRRFVFASSSSVYGDHPGLPKVEDKIGQPLSPYAATKVINEVYAGVFGAAYHFETIGLRYFNVFGPRQDPEGAYAAVIPRWFSEALHSKPIYINGDGETSRDFCYIGNVIQANLLAATTNNVEAIGRSYNIAFGERTTLNRLLAKIREQLARQNADRSTNSPVFLPARPGDIRHSHADITLARERLGYAPEYSVDDGLAKACEWYMRTLSFEKLSQQPQNPN